MIRKSILATMSLLVGAMFVGAAYAETLDTSAADQPKPHHVRKHRATHEHENANAPTRGMTMAQVERRFGAPTEKLAPAGGDAPRHPTINRWRYAGYTVYFERNRVIDTVYDDAKTAS